MTVGAAAVLVTVVTMAVWWFGRSDIPPAGAAADAVGSASLVVEPDPPLPVLESGTVTVDAQQDPFFAWTNPSPKQGDQYRWWLLASPDQTRLTGQVQVAVPRAEFDGGPVCIEVRLIRGDKTSRQPLRICEGQ
ncbi:MAG: hypothetical protein LBC97_04615 [Bifidobacteriaceae bacterium]|jgi:hypothetical protein|nr:hypothetical protein [Bifidobacteriaceae bacterium]